MIGEGFWKEGAWVQGLVRWSLGSGAEDEEKKGLSACLARNRDGCARVCVLAAGPLGFELRNPSFIHSFIHSVHIIEVANMYLALS